MWNVHQKISCRILEITLPQRGVLFEYVHTYNSEGFANSVVLLAPRCNCNFLHMYILSFINFYGLLQILQWMVLLNLFYSSILVLGRTQFKGLQFGIFGWYWRVHSSVLIDEPGFGKVRSSVFPDYGPGQAWLLGGV